MVSELYNAGTGTAISTRSIINIGPGTGTERTSLKWPQLPNWPMLVPVPGSLLVRQLTPEPVLVPVTDTCRLKLSPHWAIVL